jgi:hypothetical protein
MNRDDSTIFAADLDNSVIGLAEVYVKHDETNPDMIAYTYAYLQSMMVSGQ